MYIFTYTQILEADFNEFDWIFGMDHENVEDLNIQKPENCRAKVELLGNYHPKGNTIIQDPYYVRPVLMTILELENKR